MEYRHGPATDEKFLSVAEGWIREHGEVLVRYTLSHAAGSDGCAFCESIDSLRMLVERFPPATRVTVFRGPRLPYRGIVDAEFVKRVMSSIDDRKDYLLVTFEPEPYQIALSCCAGSSHQDLREDLDDHLGERVAVGEEPHFTTESPETAITATKGGLIGAY